MKEVADLKRYSAPTVTPQVLAWDGKHSKCEIRNAEHRSGSGGVLLAIKARAGSSFEAEALRFYQEDND